MARLRHPASLTDAHQVLRPTTPLAEIARDVLGKDHADTERETWDVRESLHRWDQAHLRERHTAAAARESAMTMTELTTFAEDLLR